MHEILQNIFQCGMMILNGHDFCIFIMIYFVLEIGVTNLIGINILCIMN